MKTKKVDSYSLALSFSMAAFFLCLFYVFLKNYEFYFTDIFPFIYILLYLPFTIVVSLIFKNFFLKKIIKQVTLVAVLFWIVFLSILSAPFVNAYLAGEEFDGLCETKEPLSLSDTALTGGVIRSQDSEDWIQHGFNYSEIDGGYVEYISNKIKVSDHVSTHIGNYTVSTNIITHKSHSGLIRERKYSIKSKANGTALAKDAVFIFTPSWFDAAPLWGEIKGSANPVYCKNKKNGSTSNAILIKRFLKVSSKIKENNGNTRRVHLLNIH